MKNVFGRCLRIPNDMGITMEELAINLGVENDV